MYYTTSLDALTHCYNILYYHTCIINAVPPTFWDPIIVFCLFIRAFLIRAFLIRALSDSESHLAM